MVVSCQEREQRNNRRPHTVFFRLVKGTRVLEYVRKDGLANRVDGKKTFFRATWEKRLGRQQNIAGFKCFFIGADS